MHYNQKERRRKKGVKKNDKQGIALGVYGEQGAREVDTRQKKDISDRIIKKRRNIKRGRGEGEEDGTDVEIRGRWCKEGRRDAGNLQERKYRKMKKRSG